MTVQTALLAGTLAVTTAIGCGSSSSSSTPTTPSPPPSGSVTRVSIVPGATTLTDTAYAPNPININAGGTVRWVNDDVVAHTSTADGGSWNSGSMAPGASFDRTFPSAGAFPYHCTLHPGMVGTVNVQ